MKLSRKLLIILIGFTCLSLLLSLAMARWSFELGFNKFVVAQEEVRLTKLSEMLSVEYGVNGASWEGISPEQRPTFDRRQPPPRRAAPPRGRHPDAPFLNDIIGPPIALLDSNGNRVSDDIHIDFPHIEVSVDVEYEGKTVGTLISYPPQTPNSEVALTFLNEQFYAFVLIGVVALGISLLVALLIVPRMLAPFKEILTTVEGLTAHQYAVSFKQRRSDEFGELMEHIEALAKALDKHEKTQKQWLADISHELRTPISILKGEIELVQAGVRPFNQAQLESFEQEVQRLSRLVDDLYQLSLADIDGLHYQFTKVEISHLISQLVRDTEHHFTNKGLIITTELAVDMYVHADSQRLTQLFLNLLLNALEYTDSPGQVKVAVKANIDSISIDFHDSAPGVKKGNEGMLFEPLFREDASRKKRTEGAGLGLAICQSIVKAHEGSISAHPSPLGGLHVRVTLPKYKATNDLITA